MGLATKAQSLKKVTHNKKRAIITLSFLAKEHAAPCLPLPKSTIFYIMCINVHLMS